MTVFYDFAADWPGVIRTKQRIRKPFLSSGEVCQVKLKMVLSSSFHETIALKKGNIILCDLKGLCGTSALRRKPAFVSVSGLF